MLVRFFNTYEPVVTLYRDLFPALRSRGTVTEVFLSSVEYREGRPSLKLLEREGITLRYAASGGLKLPGRAKKMWEMLTYACWCSLVTLFSRRSNLNFFLSQPPLFFAWGYLLKKIRRQPYCCLIMDVYPDAAVVDGLLSESPVTELAKRLSRHVLRNADRVIVIGRCMKEHLLKDLGNSERVEFIPNWASDEVVFPMPGENHPLRHELGLQDKFVVLYSGNLGVSHFFDDLLEVAGRLKNENDKVSFVFFGSGSRLREIKDAKTARDLHNITILPMQPPERLHLSLSLGDVHFISLRDGFEGLVVPSKAYGAMAAGRPILYQGNEGGEIARMISEEDIGTVVPLRDCSRLAETILRYCDQPGLARRQGQTAFELSRTKYGREHGVKRYLQVIESCVSQSKVL